ncbi:glutathione S-transferase family protein [Massilia sp. X63]|uniref:glutathione S-transferase family protein n=1 Tax=Massilia sp. X63 TaxID=3237285 RepID=UPI0034DCDDB6
MIIVYKYGYPAGTDTPDISPFVIKLETWLRMSGIPYETRTGTRREMPKAKLPSARVDGRLIADSSFIIAYLQKHDPRALDDTHLDPVQQAQAEAIQCMAESQLYFAGFYFRWCVDTNFVRYRPLLLDYAKRSVAGWQRPLLPVLGPLAISLIRRQKMRQVWAQGMARHSADEVVTIGRSALQALTTLLGEQAYLFGATPSTVDASVYGQLHALVKHPFPGPLQDFALARPELLAYHDRIKQRYWPAAAPG